MGTTIPAQQLPNLCIKLQRHLLGQDAVWHNWEIYYIGCVPTLWTLPPTFPCCQYTLIIAMYLSSLQIHGFVPTPFCSEGQILCLRGTIPAKAMQAQEKK